MAGGGQRTLGRVGAGLRGKVMPLAPRRYGLQFTIGQATHDKLRHAQALLGHQIPSGDIAQVFDWALDALIAHLEKQKFAATDRPRQRPRPTTSRRHILAHVKRIVRQRDGGRCTFVSDTGQRCAARTRLEYDHVAPVAHGGQATAGNLRLRCRTHNHYEAEQAFGVEFMKTKRADVRCGAEAHAHAMATMKAHTSAGGGTLEDRERATGSGSCRDEVTTTSQPVYACP
jgi:hypothetical protein